MHKKSIFAVLLCSLSALPSCNVEKIGEDNASAESREAVLNESCMERGIINLCLSEEKAAAIEAGESLEIESIKIKSIRRMFPDAGEFEKRHREMGLHKWYIVRYDETVPTTKAYSQLGTVEGVEIVEQVPKSKPAEVNLPFNDFYGRRNQWHLYNDGSLLDGFISGADINVLPLWKAGIVGDKKVIVAVLDTGADANNPDLADVLIPCGDNGSKNFLNGAAEATKYTIYPGDHGTHVAGIIAAVNNNNTGVCSIAGGNDGTGGVRILNLQILGKIAGEEKSESGSGASALVWAADHGAVIANNSWDYSYDSESSVPGNSSLSLISIQLAIDYFIKHAGCNSSGEQSADSPMKGGLVLFSAGNKSWSKGQPGMYEKVLAVGSCGPAFEEATYTNYGNWVDICAPGGNYHMYGKNNFARICSTITGSRYGYMQGTSMACPMVAGVAALLISHYGGQGFTAEQLKKMLLDGANKDAEKYHNRQIGPMLDARGALISQMPVPAVTDLKANIDMRSKSTLDWTVMKDYDLPTDFYFVLMSKSENKVKNFVPAQATSNDTTFLVKTEGHKSGETISLDVSNFETGTYYAAVFGRRKSQQYSAAGNVVKAQFSRYWENSPPKITTDGQNSATLKTRDVFAKTFTISDEDKDKLVVTTKTGSEAAKWLNPQTGTYRLLISAADAAPGTYKASIKAEDDFGGITVYEFIYTILPNHPVVKKADIKNQLAMMTGNGVNIQLGDYFEDEDGDEIIYKAKSSYDGVNCIIKKGSLTIMGYKYGISNITVTAGDGLSDPVSTEFKVLCSIDQNDIRIYPNPVKDKLKFGISRASEARVRVFNALGKLVHSESWTADPFEPHFLDVSGYSSGVYNVELYDGEKIHEQKIVKL